MTGWDPMDDPRSVSICRHCRFAERDHLDLVKCLYASKEYRPIRCDECLHPVMFKYDGNRAHLFGDQFIEQPHEGHCSRRYT
jgi:hypothetical protein